MHIKNQLDVNLPSMKKSAVLLIGDSRAASMKFKQSFADLHRIFALVSIKKRMAMVAGLFVLSFVDLMGLAMLVPFLAMATTNGNFSNKSLNNLIRHLFEMWACRIQSRACSLPLPH